MLVEAGPDQSSGVIASYAATHGDGGKHVYRAGLSHQQTLFSATTLVIHPQLPFPWHLTLASKIIK